MDDRRWAIGMTEQEFKDEYLRRFPWGSDVIPIVEDYIKPCQVEQRGIDRFNLDVDICSYKLKIDTCINKVLSAIIKLSGSFV